MAALGAPWTVLHAAYEQGLWDIESRRDSARPIGEVAADISAANLGLALELDPSDPDGVRRCVDRIRNFLLANARADCEQFEPGSLLIRHAQRHQGQWLKLFALGAAQALAAAAGAASTAAAVEVLPDDLEPVGEDVTPRQRPKRCEAPPGERAPAVAPMRPRGPNAGPVVAGALTRSRVVPIS